MLVTWLITAATLVVALAVIAIVAIGGRTPEEQEPTEFTLAMAQASKHLNGDAEPPKPLVELFGAIPELRPSARSADSPSTFATPSEKEAVR